MDMICCCGHDCSKCKVYLATVLDDAALREESVRFYRDQLGRDVPPERMRCLGGRSGEVMELCRECPFTKCCREKGIHSCAQCTEQCGTFQWYSEIYVNRCNQI